MPLPNFTPYQLLIIEKVLGPTADSDWWDDLDKEELEELGCKSAKEVNNKVNSILKKIENGLV